MKKGKKRKDWLIALILTAVVLGGTAGGVLYLESLLEKNKVPVSYDEPDTPPMGDEEVKPLNDEDLNPVIEDSEQKAEIAEEEKPSEAMQPAVQPADEQKIPVEEPQENASQSQESGSQAEGPAVEPEITDSPLDEDELPPF